MPETKRLWCPSDLWTTIGELRRPYITGHIRCEQRYPNPMEHMDSGKFLLQCGALAVTVLRKLGNMFGLKLTAGTPLKVEITGEKMR